MSIDPNLALILSKRLGQRIGMNGQQMLPQFSGGQGLDPNLAAIMLASGQLPKRQDMSGRFILPNAGGSGWNLDNQSFSGLDSLAAAQRPKGSSRYASPTFSFRPKIGQGMAAPATEAELAGSRAERLRFQGVQGPRGKAGASGATGEALLPPPVKAGTAEAFVPSSAQQSVYDELRNIYGLPLDVADRTWEKQKMGFSLGHDPNGDPVTAYNGGDQIFANGKNITSLWPKAKRRPNPGPNMTPQQQAREQARQALQLMFQRF